MYPDTTGNAFGGTPRPPFQPAVGMAGIPAQRSPWEPPARPQNEQSTPVKVRPVQPAPGDSGPAQSTPHSGPAQSTRDPGPTQSTLDPGPAQSTRDSGPTQSTLDPGPAQPDTQPTATAVDSGRAEPPAETVAGVDADDPDAEAGEPDPDAEAGEPDPTTTEADAEATAIAEAAPDDMGVVDLLTRADDEPAQATDRYVPTTDERATARAPAGPLRPGDVAESRIALWADASVDAETLRARIREAGSLFVDDPNCAVTAAAAVVTDAVNALAVALRRQHAELDPRRSSDNPDTESLRVAVRRYRELLDRVLAL